MKTTPDQESGLSTKSRPGLYAVFPDYTPNPEVSAPAGVLFISPQQRNSDPTGPSTGFRAANREFPPGRSCHPSASAASSKQSSFGLAASFIEPPCHS
ncbi:hypothetical protein NQZ68_036654 [Dissostichus eleginoides]|nr:hypothetical protein NQZ68_036654 [Dissostichus eleginoides]